MPRELHLVRRPRAHASPEDFGDQLAKAAPDGIDVVFDDVGGAGTATIGKAVVRP